MFFAVTSSCISVIILLICIFLQRLFDVDELLTDIYFWFDKSSKIKNVLLKYTELCHTEFRQMIKHVNVRWLSIGRCVERTLQMYEALKGYFISQEGIYLMIYPYIKYAPFTSNNLGFYGLHGLSVDLPVNGGFQQL